MRRFTAGIGIAAIAALAFWGCSSDDEDDLGGSTGGTGGVAGTGGGAGEAGTGGSAGQATGGTGGTGGSATGGTGGSAGEAGTGGGAGEAGTGGGAGEAGTGGGAGEAGAGGSGPIGACNNTEDLTTLQTADMESIIGTCVQQNLANEAKRTECIITESGLSQACGECFGASATCVINKCLTQCMAGATSQACITCREQNCDPAFETCAGLAP